MIKLTKDEPINILSEHTTDFPYFVRTNDTATELYIRVKYDGSYWEYLCYREFADGSAPTFYTYQYRKFDTFANIFGENANITILDEISFDITGKINKNFS